jgi:hypothetical protein
MLLLSLNTFVVWVNLLKLIFNCAKLQNTRKTSIANSNSLFLEPNDDRHITNLEFSLPLNN